MKTLLGFHLFLSPFDHFLTCALWDHLKNLPVHKSLSLVHSWGKTYYRSSEGMNVGGQGDDRG